MAYRVDTPSAVEKEIRHLHPVLKRRVTEAILALEDSPRPHGCKKLVDSDEWRIRVGDYRIIYDIDDRLKIVTILAVTNRSKAYD